MRCLVTVDNNVSYMVESFSYKEINHNLQNDLTSAEASPQVMKYTRV